MLLGRLSVKMRFMLVLAIGLAFQACMSVVSLANLKHTLIQARTAEVKHLLETAYSTVAFYHDQAAKGLMTDAAARLAARDAVRAMHYDGTNYFFVWTLDGTGVAHGSHPEWEGRNFITGPDAAAFPVVSTMVARLIEVARTPRKEGVASYKIPKFGQTVPLDKLAYTRLFEPWGWSIGTGAYLDDIQATFRAEAISILWVFGGLIALASILTYAIGDNLARALKRLAARVARVAKGEFDGEVPEIERRDEVGVMARALLVLRDNSRDAVELRLDQLTGLPNRKLLMDRIKQAIGASSRTGNLGGVMLIDLDKFKTLNDTQGHDAGDLLLKEAAQRLTACMRKGDTVARLGGDEFVVVVFDIGQSEKEAAVAAETVGEKILAALKQAYQLGSITYTCTASIGLTLFKGSTASIEDLLKQADLAMYRAKHAGGDACRFFDPRMELAIQERVALEKELRLAIEERQFQLHYQAQVGPGGRTIGAEALVRWNHPRRGLVLPGEFIALAEETGLILPLGRWVLETVCGQLARWATRPGLAELTISVNVGSRQFLQPGFVAQVLETLRSAGADPRKLQLEVTEGLLVKHLQDVTEKMSALKAEGVTFSLDDFGTGASSLSHLKRLPLDQLKIDRTFVAEAPTDASDAAVVRTILALAKALGFGVIAEGVENVEQRNFLASAGCRDYQGYYFSRPQPAESFEQFARHPIGVVQG
jgi:diguanylate cyclase (GGDEF)-like protein